MPKLVYTILLPITEQYARKSIKCLLLLLQQNHLSNQHFKRLVIPSGPFMTRIRQVGDTADDPFKHMQS